MYNESENITKFEIMDGASVKGETIPIRLFLGGFELGPTFRDINKKFSIRYYLNLVLIDEENRRYFKQQEITMFRRKSNVSHVLLHKRVTNIFVKQLMTVIHLTILRNERFNIWDYIQYI